MEDVYLNLSPHKEISSIAPAMCNFSLTKQYIESTYWINTKAVRRNVHREVQTNLLQKIMVIYYS